MAEVYLYLDETGTLDTGDKGNSSAFFGLGQASFRGDQGQQEWEAARLRFELENAGVHLPRGFHANVDLDTTRARVFTLIAKHRPRIDITLLRKKNAFGSVRRRVQTDEIYLYYLAWRLHFTYQAKYVLRSNDKVFVVAASLSQHRKKQQAATRAINAVLTKFPDLNITLCVWDSPTSWGLQVADYVLWAVQRDLVAGSCAHLKTVSPLIESVFRPWEGLKQRPAATTRRTKRAPSSLVVGRPTDTVRDPVKPAVAVPAAIAKQPESATSDWDDDLPDDDPRIEDPLGVGLWGNAMWSDDDPWDEGPPPQLG